MPFQCTPQRACSLLPLPSYHHHRHLHLLPLLRCLRSQCHLRRRPPPLRVPPPPRRRLQGTRAPPPDPPTTPPPGRRFCCRRRTGSHSPTNISNIFTTTHRNTTSSSNMSTDPPRPPHWCPRPSSLRRRCSSVRKRHNQIPGRCYCSRCLRAQRRKEAANLSKESSPHKKMHFAAKSHSSTEEWLPNSMLLSSAKKAKGGQPFSKIFVQAVAHTPKLYLYFSKLYTVL